MPILSINQSILTRERKKKKKRSESIQYNTIQYSAYSTLIIYVLVLVLTFNIWTLEKFIFPPFPFPFLYNELSFSSVTSTSLNRYLFYRSSTNTVLYWSSSQFHIRLKFTTRSNCTTTITTTTTTTALISRHFYSTFSIFQRPMSTSNNKLSKEISPPPPPPGQDSHSHVHSHSHDSEHSHSHSHSGASMLHHHKHSMHEPNELLAGGASAIKTNQQ